MLLVADVMTRFIFLTLKLKQHSCHPIASSPLASCAAPLHGKVAVARTEQKSPESPQYLF